MRSLGRYFLTSLVGTAVLVAWGMIFWGLLAPRIGVFHRLPNAPDVTRTLVNGNAPTGTYFMPWPRDTTQEFAEFVAQHQAGPFFRLSYVREGVNPNSPRKLLLGCLHYLTVALLAGTIGLLARDATFARRFALILCGGLLGSDLITLGDPVWFHLPWDYARGVFCYELIAWVLLGLTTAGLLGRRPRG